MQIIGIAPIHDRVYENITTGIVNTEIGKYAPQCVLAYPVDIDLATFIDELDTEPAVTELLLAPAIVEEIVFLRLLLSQSRDYLVD